MVKGMYQAGLVLEGGGMKGVYTSGVLDFFLDKELEFSSVYGVSAGACSMASFLWDTTTSMYIHISDIILRQQICRLP